MVSSLKLNCHWQPMSLSGNGIEINGNFLHKKMPPNCTFEKQLHKTKIQLSYLILAFHITQKLYLRACKCVALWYMAMAV
jgi:hypothetical protein